METLPLQALLRVPRVLATPRFLRCLSSLRGGDGGPQPLEYPLYTLPQRLLGIEFIGVITGVGPLVGVTGLLRIGVVGELTVLLVLLSVTNSGVRFCDSFSV